MLETAGGLDGLVVTLARARDLIDTTGVVGIGMATVTGPDGRVKQQVPFRNLITDAGDLYEAQKIIAGIAPASAAAPTPASGMKLGTGITPAAKAGAGAALVTYLAGSNITFATGFPVTANLGSGLGVTALYRATWAPGVATNAALTELVIVNDAATDATTTAANTYARVLFSPSAVNKGAPDTLTVDWAWKYLGA